MVIRWARALAEVVVADPGLGRAADGTRVVRVGTGVGALGARGRRGRIEHRNGSRGHRNGSRARGIGGNQRQQDGEEPDERPRERVNCGRGAAGCWAHAPSPPCGVLDCRVLGVGCRSGAPAGEWTTSPGRRCGAGVRVR
ncbi:hypothetical protein SSPO_077770 [Streptomyces antimycoticus]|uniref:Uncharacterized protein n=1 Tax=Streptomyces antimycoticus TaxID=68175 RepID=A0A499V7V6_9ACTN|nr:hypothetical protein SSPO_077770 [Streptomyces antimycoticus]